MSETKNSNKKAIVGVAIFAVVIACMAAVFFFFSPKPIEGSKAISIEVVNKAGETKLYRVNTDAEYLSQAMEDADGLEFSGSEGPYGVTLEEVNGETTDFNNGSYWSIYVNEAYGQYGIDAQPVYDGDAIKIVYEVYVAE